MSRAIVVLGATGKQGGSLIKRLVEAQAPFEIVAVTRDPSSQSAQRLLKTSSNIKVVKGNLDDAGAILSAAEKAAGTSIWGVYSVQAAIGNNAEETQGKALIDAAVTHGVKHFVYSSVDRGGQAKSDKDATNIPHFRSKYQIEQHLMTKTRDGGMDYTILRPVAFFENLVPGFFGKVFTTSWAMTLKEQQKLQLIATSDIGFFAAQAFIKSDEYKGKRITLAGDELSYREFAAIFKRTTKQELPTTFTFLAALINWAVKDLGYMFKWFRDVGYGGDIAALRENHPGMKDFASWLEKESQFVSR